MPVLVVFLPPDITKVLIPERIHLNCNCGQPSEDHSESQINAKALLIRCGPCVIIPALLSILFMSLTVLVSERGFQDWFGGDHDDRGGKKPQSLGPSVSEVLSCRSPFAAGEGGQITCLRC